MKSTLAKSFKLARSASFSSLSKSIQASSNQTAFIPTPNYIVYNIGVGIGINKSKSNLPLCRHGYQYQAHVEEVRHNYQTSYNQDLHPNDLNGNHPKGLKGKSISFYGDAVEGNNNNIENDEEVEDGEEDEEALALQLEMEVANLRNEMSSLGSTLQRLRSFHDGNDELNDLYRQGDDKGDETKYEDNQSLIHKNNNNNSSKSSVSRNRNKNNLVVNVSDHVINGEFFEEQEDEINTLEKQEDVKKKEEESHTVLASSSSNKRGGKRSMMGNMLLNAHRKGDLEKKYEEMEKATEAKAHSESDSFDTLSSVGSSSTYLSYKSTSASSSTSSSAQVSQNQSSPMLLSPSGRTQSFSRGKTYPRSPKFGNFNSSSFDTGPGMSGVPSSPISTTSTNVNGEPASPRIMPPRIREGQTTTVQTSNKKVPSPSTSTATSRGGNGRIPSKTAATNGRRSSTNGYNPPSSTSPSRRTSQSQPRNSSSNNSSKQFKGNRFNGGTMFHNDVELSPSPARRSSSSSRVKDRTVIQQRDRESQPPQRRASSSGYGVSSDVKSKNKTLNNISSPSSNNNRNGRSTAGVVSTPSPRVSSSTPRSSNSYQSNSRNNQSFSTPRSSNSTPRGSGGGGGGGSSLNKFDRTSSSMERTNNRSSQRTSQSNNGSSVMNGGSSGNLSNNGSSSSRLKVRTTPSPKKPAIIEYDETF